LFTAIEWKAVMIQYMIFVEVELQIVFLGYNTCNVKQESIVSLKNISKQIYHIDIDTSY
jgi:hypothetical protein